jgi:ADP-heptose:LPS heptosyltransferase
MRLLAIQLKRIGDLILTSPALRAMKLAHPQTHLTLAISGGTADLLPALSEWVDDALIYRAGGPGSGSNLALWGELWRGGFDGCVDFTGRDRSALMTLASRAKKRIIVRDALRRKGWVRRLCYTDIVDSPVRARHTVDHYLDHLAPLGIAPAPAAPAAPAANALAGGDEPTPPGPALRLPAPTIEAARQLLQAHGLTPGGFVLVHPGSARSEKYWLPERWAAVINYCQEERGIPCVLTGGRGDSFEDAHLAKILTRLAAPCANFAGKLDLLTLAAVIADARLFIGVDSGPMHLAAAWRKPQIALFGPTNPFHWRPRQAGCLVLQAGRETPLREEDFREHGKGQPMEGISTPTVIGCINQLLDK